MTIRKRLSAADNAANQLQPLLGDIQDQIQKLIDIDSNCTAALLALQSSYPSIARSYINYNATINSVLIKLPLYFPQAIYQYINSIENMMNIVNTSTIPLNSTQNLLMAQHFYFSNANYFRQLYQSTREEGDMIYDYYIQDFTSQLYNIIYNLIISKIFLGIVMIMTLFSLTGYFRSMRTSFALFGLLKETDIADLQDNVIIFKDRYFSKQISNDNDEDSDNMPDDYESWEIIAEEAKIMERKMSPSSRNKRKSLAFHMLNHNQIVQASNPISAQDIQIANSQNSPVEVSKPTKSILVDSKTSKKRKQIIESGDPSKKSQNNGKINFAIVHPIETSAPAGTDPAPPGLHHVNSSKRKSSSKLKKRGFFSRKEENEEQYRLDDKEKERFEAIFKQTENHYKNWLLQILFCGSITVPFILTSTILENSHLVQLKNSMSFFNVLVDLRTRVTYHSGYGFETLFRGRTVYGNGFAEFWQNQSVVDTSSFVINDELTTIITAAPSAYPSQLSAFFDTLNRFSQLDICTNYSISRVSDLIVQGKNISF